MPYKKNIMWEWDKKYKYFVRNRVEVCSIMRSISLGEITDEEAREIYVDIRNEIKLLTRTLNNFAHKNGIIEKETNNLVFKIERGEK